jgi:hypothetical protein
MFLRELKKDPTSGYELAVTEEQVEIRSICSCRLILMCIIIWDVGCIELFVG